MLKEEDKEKVRELNEDILKARHIVFFGGAGVSTESGIPDFRSAHGIYTDNLSAEEIVSHDYFFADPQGFYDFYKSKMVFLNAKPNACHLKLSEIERLGKDVTVITQNIDGLHQKAGSTKVIELHGSVHCNHCLKCGAFYTAEEIMGQKGVPYCPKCGGLIKPDVVLYGEELDMNAIVKALNALEQADLLIVGGTSLKVYPAASFIDYYQGEKKYFINLNDNPLHGYTYLNEKIGEVFSALTLK